MTQANRNNIVKYILPKDLFSWNFNSKNLAAIKRDEQTYTFISANPHKCTRNTRNNQSHLTKQKKLSYFKMAFGVLTDCIIQRIFRRIKVENLNNFLGYFFIEIPQEKLFL
jgi:hypothetical protein